MDARNEALSLRDNPLPPEQITSMPGDELLPSRILQADGHIGSLEKALLLAREARQALMERAIALKIGEDEHAIIIVKESLSDREIDVERFKVEKPVIYKQALQIEISAEREKIQKKIEDMNNNIKNVDIKAIRISTLKTLLGEDDITALSLPRKITPTYQVQSVKVPIPKGKGIKLLSEVQP